MTDFRVLAASTIGFDSELARLSGDCDRLNAERDDARRNALDEAIAPLLELAAPLRTGAQRDALAACVIRKLHSAWAARKPAGGGQ